MSRYKPVSLRHKSGAARSQATAQTLATLGLRVAAIACWIGTASLIVGAVRTTIDNLQAGAGLAHWEPAVMVVGAVAALVVGWRVWEFKWWACIAAVAVVALVCLIEPWWPANYRDAVVDPLQAIATSLVACLLFVAPLVYALIIERSKLRSGF